MYDSQRAETGLLPVLQFLRNFPYRANKIWKSSECSIWESPKAIEHIVPLTYLSDPCLEAKGTMMGFSHRASVGNRKCLCYTIPLRMRNKFVTYNAHSLFKILNMSDVAASKIFELNNQRCSYKAICISKAYFNTVCYKV